MVFGFGNKSKKRQELIKRFCKNDAHLIAFTKRLLSEKPELLPTARYLWEAFLHHYVEFKELLTQFQHETEVVEALDMVQSELEHITRREFLRKGAALAGSAMLDFALPTGAFAQSLQEKIDTQLKEVQVNSSVEGWERLSELYFTNNDLNSTRFAAEEALKLNPSSITANNSLANYYLRGNNFPEAEKYLQIAMKHPNQHVLTNMALLELKRKNFTKSVEYAQKAIAIKQIPTAYNVLGAAYFNLKEYTNAKLAYTRALELDPSFTPAKNALEYIKKTVN